MLKQQRHCTDVSFNFARGCLLYMATRQCNCILQSCKHSSLARDSAVNKLLFQTSFLFVASFAVLRDQFDAIATLLLQAQGSCGCVCRPKAQAHCTSQCSCYFFWLPPGVPGRRVTVLGSKGGKNGARSARRAERRGTQPAPAIQRLHCQDAPAVEPNHLDLLEVFSDPASSWLKCGRREDSHQCV